MKPIDGQCDSDYDACQIVSAYLGDNVASNWLDRHHCQYHMQDTWEVVGKVELIDKKWQYSAWETKNV